MKIGIVNDQQSALDILHSVVSHAEEFEISWLAQNGSEAVEHCRTDLPDIVLMDLHMPVMEGVEATRQIMGSTPCAILIVTSSVDGYSPMVFEALGCGAMDAVNTPTLTQEGELQGGDVLLAKLKSISKLIDKKVTLASSPKKMIQPAQSQDVTLVLIGASTGGPGAIDAILGSLSGQLNAAFVVVQHIDAYFVEGFARYLNQHTDLCVQLAKRGVTPAPGNVYVARANHHLVLTPNQRFDYVEDDTLIYHPSINTCFNSVASGRGTPGIAILLTGMGHDGAEGLLALRQAGWHTIAQDKESSIVYGMPKAAVSLDAAVEVLPLNRIEHTLLKRLKHSTHHVS